MTDAIDPNPYAPPRALVADAAADAPIEMVQATRGQRFLAVLVDGSPGIVIGLVAALMVPGIFSGAIAPNGSGMATFGLLMLVFGLLCVGWLVWMAISVYRYGQTLGKRALGIRVVRTDGSRITFPRIFFLRGLGVAVIAWIVMAIGLALHLPFLGNLVTLVDSLLIFGAARRCLHDYIADSMVVTAASSPNATLEGSRGR